MNGWIVGDYLQLASIVVSVIIAITIYLLQKRLSAKQRIDNRLNVETKAGQKIYDIQYNDHSRKVQLYNSKLLNKKYFAENKRDVFWGYPYHAAELYGSSFDGLEFIIGIEKWGGKKYYKVGVIPYERILGVKPDGDGSFNGMIFYVKPRLIQKDKYAIAYKSYRYYPVKNGSGYAAIKPLATRIIDAMKKFFSRSKYYFYYKWKNQLQNRKGRG